MNEFFNFTFRTFISSIHSIAKMEPKYLDLILTDYNLILVLEDIDNKMYDSFNNYLKNKDLFLNSDKGYSNNLYKTLIQKYYLELCSFYNLFLIYYEMMIRRKLDYSFKSDITNIKITCDIGDYGLKLNK